MFILQNLITAFLAFLIDYKFGEFKFIKHPIIFIGELISFLEKKLYKDSVFYGGLLTFLTLLIVGIFVYIVVDYLAFLPKTLEIIVTSFIASMFISFRMLKDEVSKVLKSDDIEVMKKQISTLVSRDTKDMTKSDVYKASLETYAENLSDGVVAPLFYLVLFGLPGIILYKTVNTLDSMVGYKNQRYEKFGKISAKLDDVLNYIPSRITAIFIMIKAKQKDIFSFYEDGKKHSSPNAGHPITAMALSLGVKLGGPTSYFGEVKQKPFFGKGKEEITKKDLEKGLNI
jgi:adenosylcobinamide-phosphate synthase